MVLVYGHGRDHCTTDGRVSDDCPGALRCEGHQVERYIIVAGERRWRAASMAGLAEVPVVVRADLDERAAFLVSLVENVLRADMTPIEEANGYQWLLDGGMTSDEVARSSGKSIGAIRTALSLLRLDVPIQELVEKGHLSAWDGSRLATLSINGQHRALRVIGEHGLTGNDRDRVIGEVWRTEHQVELFGADTAASAGAQRAGKAVRDHVEAAARELGKAEAMLGEADLGELTVDLADALVKQVQRLARLTRAARAARLVAEQLRAG